MGGTERSECDAQFGFGGSECGGGLQGRLDERAPLIVGADIVRPDQIHQIAFDLIGQHLQDIGQVLALGR